METVGVKSNNLEKYYRMLKCSFMFGLSTFIFSEIYYAMLKN